MDKKIATYEEMNDELETIIELLQSGQLSLDEAVSKYERASALIKQLEKYLEQTQNKILKIKADL